MPIDIRCPGCSRTLRVGDQYAGRQVRCPACQTVSAAPAQEPQGGGLGAPLSDRAAATWHMRTPEGATYGPVSWDELSAWAAQGRMEAECELAEQASSPWRPASEIFPALAAVRQKALASAAAGPAIHPWTAAQTASAGWSAPASDSPYSPSASAASAGSPFGATAAGYVVPHRGGLILVLGLVGFVIGCPIFSLMAWVMGSHDLREMRAGRMDRSGEGLTQVGQILGMIQSLLWIGGAVLIMGLILLAAVAGA